MPRYKTKSEWIGELDEITNGTSGSFSLYGPMGMWLLSALRYKTPWLSDDSELNANTLIEIIERTAAYDAEYGDGWSEVGSLRWLNGDFNALTAYHDLVSVVRGIASDDIAQEVYDHLFADFSAVTAAMRPVVRSVYRPLYDEQTQQSLALLGGVSVRVTPIFAGRGHFTLHHDEVVVSMMGASFDRSGDSLRLHMVVAPSLEAVLRVVRLLLSAADTLEPAPVS